MLQSSPKTPKTGPAVMTQQVRQKQTKQHIFSKDSVIVNFVAGGIGGTVGVFVTCPLDVVQTRLQSSIVKLNASRLSSPSASSSALVNLSSSRFGLNVISYMKHIVQTEGLPGLYKGLVPNLIGIAPSRAIYFAVYTKSKAFLMSTHLSNSSWTHMLSALSASWSTSSLTNPIWFLKTRLQLDLTANGKRRPLLEVVKEVFHNEGICGFYRGLSASYVGASETMIYFVLYERLKLMLKNEEISDSKLSAIDYVCAAFLAKFAATISVYPHEVARTRLRQEALKQDGKKLYYGFFQTLSKVYKEEKLRGLYGGMGAHLMRQVPNTVIMFVTYETIVNLLSKE